MAERPHPAEYVVHCKTQGGYLLQPLPCGVHNILARTWQPWYKSS